MDIEYKVEFSYEEFRGMLTKTGSCAILIADAKPT